MEGGGIEVRSVRPDEGAGFGIQADLVEDPWVGQRAKHLTGQDRAEIDLLGRPVLKLDPEDEGSDLLETPDTVNLMR